MLGSRALKFYATAMLMLLVANIQWIDFRILGFVALFVVWRYRIAIGVAEAPTKLIKNLLTLSAIPLVYWVWGQFLSLEALVSLVLLGTALKLIELSNARDTFVAIMALMFVSSLAFLFDQSVVTFVAVIVGLVCSLCTLHVIVASRSSIRPVLMICIQAIPIVAMIFVLSPRVGPLWSMPLASQTAKTGMSDSLRPGDIASLIKSADLVFRAEFDSDKVSKPLYWRALVLDHNDEGVWRASGFAEAPRYRRIPEVTSADLTMVVEPSADRWLYTLEGYMPAGGRFGQTESGLWQFLRPPVRATQVQFQKVSSQAAPAAAPRNYLRSVNTSLTPRLSSWVEQQVQLGYSPKAIIQNLYQRFNGEFYYTLTPPTFDTGALDSFMFDSKAGFCEHFAALTATVARMVGTPSRIVTGYLGGRLSQDQSHWVVRQYDAHAWVELWYEGEGWVRVDPTSAVAPERIESGFDALEVSGEWISSRSNFGGIPGFQNLLNQWQDLNYQFIAFMGSFSNQQQASLIQRLLGALSISKLIMIVVAILALIMLPILLKRPRLPSRNTLLKWRIERAARSKGIPRSANQSLHAVCLRLAELQPDKASYWRAMAAKSEKMFYGA